MKIYAWLFAKVAKISKKLAKKMISLTSKDEIDFYEQYYRKQQGK